MRVAVVADIHGNYHALDAVLADLAQQGIDQIIVNGDSVNRGPDSVKVLQRLRNVPHRQTLGNHDDLMLMALEPNGKNSWLSEPFWASVRYAATELEAAGLLEPFRTLANHLEFTEHGSKFIVAHGSPRHYREGLGQFLTPEVFSEILEEHPADFLIGSHTHRPFVYEWGPHTVLNSGAVGMPFNGDPRAQYLILEHRNGAWTWRFRRIPYDRDAAINHFLGTEYYREGGVSTHIYVAEMRHARSIFAPFTMWATKYGHELDHASWDQFQQQFADRFIAAEMKQEIFETKEAG